MTLGWAGTHSASALLCRCAVRGARWAFPGKALPWAVPTATPAEGGLHLGGQQSWCDPLPTTHTADAGAAAGRVHDDL